MDESRLSFCEKALWLPKYAEFAKAICGNPKIIGASVRCSAVKTAYMHESVSNVKRIYEGAKQLRVEARDTKPVMMGLDEFDSWFMNGRNGGNHSDKDMQQIKNVLQEVLDGVEDYHGIITLAMTNESEVSVAKI